MLNDENIKNIKNSMDNNNIKMSYYFFDTNKSSEDKENIDFSNNLPEMFGNLNVNQGFNEKRGVTNQADFQENNYNYSKKNQQNFPAKNKYHQDNQLLNQSENISNSKIINKNENIIFAQNDDEGKKKLTQENYNQNEKNNQAKILFESTNLSSIPHSIIYSQIARFFVIKSVDEDNIHKVKKTFQISQSNSVSGAAHSKEIKNSKKPSKTLTTTTQSTSYSGKK